ncbi:MAG: glycosyltransferase family 4 protein [Planctomycetota bacterium]
MTLVSQSQMDEAFESQPPRISIVCPHFWPISGARELGVAELATQLKSDGCEVEIITGRWSKSWPAQFHFQEIPIRRVGRNSNSPWSSIRYIRNLQRALEENRPDGIIVFGLGDEAWTVAKSMTGRIPYVVRLDNFCFGPRDGKPNLSSKQIQILQSADRVFAESEWTYRRLQAHPSLESVKVSVLPIGLQLPAGPLRSPTRQATSRMSLCDAHPVLTINPVQPLAVSCAPLNGDDGMLDLIWAWKKVTQVMPNARLWVIGEGIRSREVWEKVIDLDLVHSVIMPGSFDDLGIVFEAADLYIHPLRTSQTCSNLDRAMAAGLSPVATTTEFTQNRISHGSNGIVIAPAQPGALAEAIMYALNQPELRARLGERAASSARKFDIAKAAHPFLDALDRHWRLRTKQQV